MSKGRCAPETRVQSRNWSEMETLLHLKRKESIILNTAQQPFTRYPVPPPAFRLEYHLSIIPSSTGGPFLLSQ